MDEMVSDTCSMPGTDDVKMPIAVPDTNSRPVCGGKMALMPFLRTYFVIFSTKIADKLDLAHAL
jgi:hypothetical protein